MRPAAGEIDLALESLDPVDLRRLWRRETAGRHDVMAAGNRRAAVVVSSQRWLPRSTVAAATLCRSGCRAADRSGQRRSPDSAGFRAGSRISPTRSRPCRVRDRTCSCSRSSGCRSARRDSGSSTRCRRRRRPLPGPTVEKPALRNRWRRYNPAKPAPTTATSTCRITEPESIWLNPRRGMSFPPTIFLFVFVA